MSTGKFTGKPVSIWTLQPRLSRNLLLWSGLSVVTGGALMLTTPFWRGVGVQGVVWGAIDAGIALVGLSSMRRRYARLEDPEAPEVVAREARKLRRLLLINAGLDVLYVAGGGVLVLTFGRADEFARGNGVGIIVQGAFLLLFDLFYARRTGSILAYTHP